MNQQKKKESRYSKAVSLYATTRLSIKEDCEQTHISFVAFCSYLSRNHPELIEKRRTLLSKTDDGKE